MILMNSYDFLIQIMISHEIIWNHIENESDGDRIFAQVIAVQLCLRGEAKTLEAQGVAEEIGIQPQSGNKWWNRSWYNDYTPRCKVVHLRSYIISNSINVYVYIYIYYININTLVGTWCIFSSMNTQKLNSKATSRLYWIPWIWDASRCPLGCCRHWLLVH